jgi:hypothetical protein
MRCADRLFDLDFRRWRIEKTLPHFGANVGISGWIHNVFGSKQKGTGRQRWSWSANHPQRSAPQAHTARRAASPVRGNSRRPRC